MVVGSGLYGAIFAHEAKAHGKSVLVIDKCPNIAGNMVDGVTAACIVALSFVFNLHSVSYVSWAMLAIATGLLAAVITVLFNLIVYKNRMMFLVQIVLRRKKK